MSSPNAPQQATTAKSINGGYAAHSGVAGRARLRMIEESASGRARARARARIASVPDVGSFAVELAILRGEMLSGFERLSGEIALVAQNQARNSADINDLDGRTDGLEERRIPVGLLATVSGVVSAVVAGGAFLAQL